jgi:hypothetical protein
VLIASDHICSIEKEKEKKKKKKIEKEKDNRKTLDTN